MGDSQRLKWHVGSGADGFEDSAEGALALEPDGGGDGVDDRIWGPAHRMKLPRFPSRRDHSNCNAGIFGMFDEAELI